MMNFWYTGGWAVSSENVAIYSSLAEGKKETGRFLCCVGRMKEIAKRFDLGCLFGLFLSYYAFMLTIYGIILMSYNEEAEKMSKPDIISNMTGKNW